MRKAESSFEKSGTVEGERNENFQGEKGGPNMKTSHSPQTKWHKVSLLSN